MSIQEADGNSFGGIVPKGVPGEGQGTEGYSVFRHKGTTSHKRDIGEQK